MTFSYSEYSQTFLLYPLVFIIFLTPMLISIAHALIRCLLDSFTNNLKEIATLGFVCVIVVCAIISSISTLASGGAWLFVENETSSVEATGTITEIERVGKHEYQFMMNGTMYTIIDTGDFGEGDFVSITYLPKSKYVLSMQEP